MSELTSKSVLHGICDGADDAAWARFLTIYGPLLDSWMRRRGVPADIADDVRQEVLMKVHQEIDQFQHNGRPGAFRAWLRQVTAHRLRTVLRRQWREPQAAGNELFDLADQLGEDDSKLTHAWNAEHDAELLQRLLQLIAPDFQPHSMLAFRRIVLENQRPETVAADLGMSLNAVRIAQSRVLAALRRVGEGILET